MSDAWRMASIESFEQVPASPATALLRVAAVSTFDADATDARPTLVIDDGHEPSRFASLPAPPDEGAVLRCAFSVPAALVASAATFSLQFDDGFVIALSRPTAVGRRPRPAPLGVVAVEPDARTVTLRLHLEAIEARAELQALRDLTALSPSATPDERMLTLEHERDAAVAEARSARARLEELEIWSAELERRLAATTTELARARADEGLEPLRRAAVERAHRIAERDLAQLDA